MINVIDDFLDEVTHKQVYNKLLNNEFQEVVVGEKSFFVQYSDEDFNNFIIDKISKLEGIERKCLLGFFRVSTDKLDTVWGIHADSKICDIRPERAIVLYISESTKEGVHGTAFWKHKEIGYEMPNDASDEYFDKILTEDACDLSKWDLHSIIGYKQNRAVMYPSNYFHSKYPNESWEGGRMVYVMFYI
jgi:hypothetical protein